MIAARRPGRSWASSLGSIRSTVALYRPASLRLVGGGVERFDEGRRYNVEKWRELPPRLSVVSPPWYPQQYSAILAETLSSFGSCRKKYR
jgi:hypothetical protein